MKVAIHQPHYLPWLGYLAKWAAADLFVFLDTVQFEKHGWQNRNRVKTRDGARWLTVPIRARLGVSIADVAIDTAQPWAGRHLRTIEHAYAGTPWLERYRADLKALYAQPWHRLAPLAAASAEWLARAAGIEVPWRLASELGADGADPSGRLVAICRAVGADTYLAGRDSHRYLDRSRFAEAGIGVLVQDYRHPMYRQVHGDFVPSLSALDLLLTHGDEALPILRRGDSWS